MKNFKIMRTVCIDIAVVLFVTLIINIFLKKSAVLLAVEAVLCIISLIVAYSCHKKVSQTEKLSK
jgi:hypothetical protein